MDLKQFHDLSTQNWHRRKSSQDEQLCPWISIHPSLRPSIHSSIHPFIRCIQNISWILSIDTKIFMIPDWYINDSDYESTAVQPGKKQRWKSEGKAPWIVVKRAPLCEHIVPNISWILSIRYEHIYLWYLWSLTRTSMVMNLPLFRQGRGEGAKSDHGKASAWLCCVNVSFFQNMSWILSIDTHIFICDIYAWSRTGTSMIMNLPLFSQGKSKGGKAMRFDQWQVAAFLLCKQLKTLTHATKATTN